MSKQPGPKELEARAAGLGMFERMDSRYAEYLMNVFLDAFDEIRRQYTHCECGLELSPGRCNICDNDE